MSCRAEQRVEEGNGIRIWFKGTFPNLPQKFRNIL